MEIGIDSFAVVLPDPMTGTILPPEERLENLLDEVTAADQVGLDVFGIGEHHRPEFVDSAPVVILAAAAARTTRIRLASAVTVLSTADPVRVFQEFATLDLLTRGRAEITVGRGSFGEAYPLFGYQPDDYDALFVEKLDLLLRLRETPHIRWSGRYRPALTGQSVYPRPYQDTLPIWIGVGGTPQSFVRAGTLGLPLMVAIIGGEFRRFRPLVDLYREAGQRAGFAPEQLRIGVHAIGFVGETSVQARDTFFPGWQYMFTELGRERGWSPATRDQFDAMCEPGGAFLIGDPSTVAAKILAASDALGGVSRITFQMSSTSLAHDAMLQSIELLGREVAPAVRSAAASKQAVFREI
ncbi:LLM class flavin-dependent oxidoreductase [Burkholderia sp. WAC0059]|uniref:LLM class flavin-dependent oxidoreductase n=1 Tax=Burkholderia sp. WAC0059 TaxID=2066022 RepID=UPI000C7EA030|nr:LLM class flavin-dependent oxidoreductase [Burkholderia sp. WAC0059]PLZ00726.1 LLM class flavin-dependent oxidoreductase [Burkholderia sp. WAC0059]